MKQKIPPRGRPGSNAQAVYEIANLLLDLSRPGMAVEQVFATWLRRVEVVLDTLIARAYERPGPPPGDEMALVEEAIGQALVSGEVEHPEQTGLAAAAARLIKQAVRPPVWPWGRDADMVGLLHAYLGNPSPFLEQYGTPGDLAGLVSRLLMESGPERRLGSELLTRRLAEAVQVAGDNSAEARIRLEATGWLTHCGVGEGYFFKRVLPLILPYVRPIWVGEPAVGSGSLLLAVANQFPPWVRAAGIVRFWGCDIDPVSVRIARINCKLYGLLYHCIEEGDFFDIEPPVCDIWVANPPFGGKYNQWKACVEKERKDPHSL